jgi:hypothetical protein
MFEQFNQDLKALLNKEEEAKKNLDETRGEINKLKDKFCKHLTASFKKYIGKKVVVTGHYYFQHPNEPEKKVQVVGYFGGFTKECVCHSDIYPLVYRIKKDGEPSKIAYGQFDTPKLDEALRIEFYVE